MAERLVYKPACGCEVYRIMHSNPNLYRIQYCPKHKWTSALYEALKAFDCNIDFVNDTNSNKYELLKVLTYNLRKALAEAGLRNKEEIENEKRKIVNLKGEEK